MTYDAYINTAGQATARIAITYAAVLEDKHNQDRSRI